MKTLFLQLAASTLLLAADEGREIGIEGKKVLVSDERTTVTIRRQGRETP